VPKVFQRDKKRYELGDDGLLVEKVGPWAEKKLKIIADYVHASGGARRKWSDAAYIDVFCGPGRSKVRDTTRFIDGSPVVAFKKARASPAFFTSINISDYDSGLLSAAEERLQKLDAPVRTFAGPASAAMPRIVQSLSSAPGLHLAFLDPHGLGTLSFDLFEHLAKLPNIDVIAHVSLADLRRNADRYTSDAHDQFDRFAPDWQDHVSTNMNQQALREAIIRYWSDKVEALGLPRAKHCELFTGTQGQQLYWLILLARHPLAHNLWQKISSIAKEPEFDL
jgi:three-Cys-motif partner protein